MKIDFHAHAFPEAFFLKLKAYYPDEVVLRQDTRGHMIGIQNWTMSWRCQVS
jgi:hypothetical protein